MNTCNEQMRENCHFSLKETELANGEVKVTVAELPNKEWIGPSRNAVLKKVQDDLYEMEGKRELVTVPAVFMSGGIFAGGKIIQ